MVRISLRIGKPPEYLRAISDSVHAALVEAYNVPEHDRFHVFHQHTPDEFFYDPDYLGIHRSDDVVFFHITAGKWRDTRTKRRFYKALTARLADSPGMRSEDVQVVLSPTDPDDWSFGRGEAPYADAN
jgi:phenylpyruvate tautomerase PptA (4-oxalocrotonate tautomerase family)